MQQTPALLNRTPAHRNPTWTPRSRQRNRSTPAARARRKARPAPAASMDQCVAGNTRGRRQCCLRRSCLLRNERIASMLHNWEARKMQALATPDQVNFSPLQRRYTLEEFWALPEREDHARYNLIGGYLYMVPAPNPHGDLDGRLTKSLVGFVVKNDVDGLVHHPPEPIYVAAEASTYLEPDMM